MGARPPLARAMALRGQGPPMAALNGSDALQAQRKCGLCSAGKPFGQPLRRLGWGRSRHTTQT